jgi:hypothetical protein
MGRLPDSRTAFTPSITGQRLLLDDDEPPIKPKPEDRRLTGPATPLASSNSFKQVKLQFCFTSLIG